ncbi:MAG: phage portal protein [Acetatifactor sp.]|nr:phage portal protein [Acetatifactor sp.]
MNIPWHRNSKSFHDVCHGVYGRKVIISNRTSITTPKEAIEELENALPIHNQNRREMDYLYHYVAGDQPILYRQKDVRPEINNKIVENHALEINRFMTAQNYGEPIQYTSVRDNPEISAEIDKLNVFMKTRSKDYHDIVLGDFQSTMGTAYRETWSCKKDEVDEGEPMFDMESPDPRYNFIIYSSAKGHPALMSVSIREDEKGRTVYYCTTKSYVYYIRDSKYIAEKSSPNGHKRILLIEFPNNPRRLSDIEIVHTMTDAINEVQSNRLDGVAQFVQAFIKFVNCEIDEKTFLKMCKIGALSVKTVNPSLPADVNSVSSELNQEQTQTLKDDLYKNMLIIEGMPSREQNTGGDTGQAVYLRNGWDFAEQRAKIDEPVTKKSEREFLKIVLNILKTKQQISSNLTIADIDIKITRNKTDNMLVKAQALLYLLEKGIHPKIAIQTCDLWGDPEKVYVESKPYLDALYKTALEKQAELEKEREYQISLSSGKGGGDDD